MRPQKLIFLFSFFILLGIFSFSRQALADSPTIITEDITTDTTWTLNDSPYIVNNSFAILLGATLTIESGVVVKFDFDTYIDVFGVLKASGAPLEPIYFTSYYDEAVASDVDDETFCFDDIDEEGNVLGEICETFDYGDPAPGDWGGIYINDITGTSVLSYVTFSYADIAFYVFATEGFSATHLNISHGYSGLTLEESKATLSDITEIDITGDAFDLYNNSQVVANNITIENARAGITVFETSSLILSEANISNILQGGITIFSASILDANHVTIDNTSSNALAVFNDSKAILDNSFITNNQYFGGAVNIFNNSSFSASETIFDGGVGDGIDVFSNTTGVSLNLSHSTVKNFSNSGIANFGSINTADLSTEVISIEHSIITGNDIGIDIYNDSPTSIATVDIKNNSIFDNISFGARTFSEGIKLALTDNWWGNETGPYNETLNPEGLGNAVSDFIDFAPFCKKDACFVRNPVIIVPGVLGTEISKPTVNGPEKLWLDLAHNLTDIGDEFMDALQFKTDLTPMYADLIVGDVIRKTTFLGSKFDYSDGLIQEFTKQGYVEGTDLFLFPYDWRYGVGDSIVGQLKQKITNVLTTSGTSKVDIVAHSMGGLIVKNYVIENPVDNHINKAIFVGVPNTGSPKAVKNLLIGDGNLLTADNEMKKISKNMPAAYDLLPSAKYFNDKGSYVEIIDQGPLSSVRRDLNFEEMNDFLTADHDLSAEALIRAHNLHTSDFDNYDLRTVGIDLYAVDGCKTGTIGKIRELRRHGFFADSVSYIAPYEVPGDGTVPLESATNLPIDEGNKFYSLKGKHGDMLSSDGIRQQIVKIIFGSDLETENITQDISECKLNGRAVSIYSPLSIDVIDQDGNHAGFLEDGVSIENNIPNADFQIVGEHKFIYLPTDDGQIYTIKLKGTGAGTFTLTDATIEDNEIMGMQVFKNISVTPSLLGHINLAESTILALDINGDETIDQTLSPSLLLDAQEAKNFVPDQENINEVIPEDNSSNNTTSNNTGRKIPLQTVALIETPKEIPKIEQKNTLPTIKLIQKQEKSEPTKKENMLTAAVADTDMLVDYKIIIMFLLGVIIVLLLAKKFNKE